VDALRTFTVTPAAFAAHLDLVVARGLRTLTVSELLAARQERPESLARAVVITFDDGFADTAEIAAPALRERGLSATLFAVTGVLGQTGPFAVPMLSWSELADLRAAGFEIGAHSHTHPHLDTLGSTALRDEVRRSRAVLEDGLGAEVATFAYPHGYSSPRVRQCVRSAGYRGACAIKNTFSSAGDDRWALARLTVEAGTSPDRIADWLDRRGAPPPPRGESLRTRGWRAYRRLRALGGRRAGADPGWAAAARSRA
jgi:peptidoglycan/xylan/chitin deacetylase (PgdA/CDA1 family)